MQPAGVSLVEPLRDRIGPGVRAVAHHDGDSWNIAYLRDDLQSEYRDDDMDEIAQDLVLTELSRSQQESLYGLGDLEATVRLFEHGLIVHVPAGERSGYFVSLESDADVRGREVVNFVRQEAGLA